MKSELQPFAGSPAPDYNLRDTENAPVTLSSFWADRSVVIVFLRHLGCTFCRTHVIELCRQYAQFQQENTEIVCVAMGSPKVAKAFKLLFDLPFPLLTTGDDTEIYRLFNLQKATWGQVFGAPMWATGFTAIRQLGLKKLHGGLQGDGFQLQGTFIVDSLGIVRLAYRGKDAADNPSNTLLLETLHSIHTGESVHAPVTTTAA